MLCLIQCILVFVAFWWRFTADHRTLYLRGIIATTNPNYLFYIFVTFDFSVLFLTKMFHQVFAEEVQGRGQPSSFWGRQGMCPRRRHALDSWGSKRSLVSLCHPALTPILQISLEVHSLVHCILCLPYTHTHAHTDTHSLIPPSLGSYSLNKHVLSSRWQD